MRDFRAFVDTHLMPACFLAYVEGQLHRLVALEISHNCPGYPAPGLQTAFVCDSAGPTAIWIDFLPVCTIISGCRLPDYEDQRAA